ncbi:hypothetical protein CI102_7057 [Trichoderma harzianum]|nr:hypothetical protein CI102_7057 [Trichoderma harzianum]
MIPIKNADIHQNRFQHLPIQSQYIIGKQHQLKHHIQPQRHSSQYNPLTINHLHTLFDLNHTLPFQPHQNHQQQSQRSNLAFLLMQGQHINPKERKKKKNHPAISPLDPTSASSSPSPTWKEMTSKRGGPKQDPP